MAKRIGRPENPDDDVLDARRAAIFLDMHEETLRRLSREGKVPCYKVGGLWRFNKSMLYRWAESQQVQHAIKRILIVDDDEMIREAVGQVLASGGYAVTLAAGGEEALEIIRKSLPDLMILDLKLPGLSGPDTLHAVRQRYGQLPVIILTGYPESQLMTEALRHSPFLLLSKPATAAQILQSVKLTLG